MSQYSAAFTLGFQRGLVNESELPRSSFDEVPANPKHLQGVVTIKHWDGNSLEDSDGFTRHTFSDNASNFVLADSYFPAFRAGIKVRTCETHFCAQLSHFCTFLTRSYTDPLHPIGGCTGSHVRLQLGPGHSELHLTLAEAAASRVGIRRLCDIGLGCGS